ncbi:hypothetical protein [Polyangium sp. 6x1]|uniref:hypothetical protein n=1 Tax=Polyangium sp. 6x1 TaxID=3042689 RepID=UPI00248310C5|nr:hypothetical protein [Polyangium sp. 6x1]MDI1444874.1 hypothetical protein [Polyangium sp. 6x1]
MTTIVRPACAGQESTDLPEGSVESGSDQEPASIPAVLTPDQQERVRVALLMYAQGKTLHDVAVALGYAREYVRAVLEARLYVTVHFAGAVARVLGTEISALTQ